MRFSLLSALVLPAVLANAQATPSEPQAQAVQITSTPSPTPVPTSPASELVAEEEDGHRIE